MSAARKVMLAVCLAAVIGGSFKGGLEYSRQQIRDATDDLANEGEGTNTFSRCLTELWEKSGELDPDWKGEIDGVKRVWILKEPRS